MQCTRSVSKLKAKIINMNISVIIAVILDFGRA